MLPFITIADQKIHIIYLFAFLYLLVYVFVFWLQSRRDLKNNSIFDIAFITFLVSILVSRLLGMLSHLDEYRALGWNFLPVGIEQEQFVFFKNNPWTFFGIGDGNFLYIGLFFGVVLGVIILYLNSNQKKSVYLLFERLVITYCCAAVFILLGQYLGGIDLGATSENSLSVVYPDGTHRYPLQLFQIGVLLLFLIFEFGHKRILHTGQSSSRIRVFWFFVYFGMSEFLLRPLYNEYVQDFLETIDLTQLISLVILVLGLLLVFTRFLSQKKKSKEGKFAYPTSRIERTRLLNRNYANIDSVRKYNLSYSTNKERKNK